MNWGEDSNPSNGNQPPIFRENNIRLLTTFTYSPTIQDWLKVLQNPNPDCHEAFPWAINYGFYLSTKYSNYGQLRAKGRLPSTHPLIHLNFPQIENPEFQSRMLECVFSFGRSNKAESDQCWFIAFLLSPGNCGTLLEWMSSLQGMGTWSWSISIWYNYTASMVWRSKVSLWELNKSVITTLLEVEIETFLKKNASGL